MINRQLNVVASPVSENDWNFGNIISLDSRPSAFSLGQYLPPVKDQKDTGFCHSYSGSAMKEAHEIIERGFFQEMSPLNLAKNVKSIDNLPYTEGTTGLDICKALSKFGTIPEQFYPSDDYVANSFNFPLDNYTGKRFYISNYAKCNTSEEVKQAIALGKFVLVGFQANRMIHDVYNENEIPVIPLFDQYGRFIPIGGHMVLAYAYDEDYVYIQNSWGEDWGYKGLAKMENRYFDFRTSDIGFGFILDNYCFIDLDNDPINAQKIELFLDDTEAFIDGQVVTLDAEPEIVNDRITVPVRFISEVLGYDVEWTDATKRICITNEDTKVILYIDNDIMKVNWTDVRLDVAPYIKNDRSMIPLRAVSEAFGCEVLWDNNLRKATILKR